MVKPVFVSGLFGIVEWTSCRILVVCFARQRGLDKNAGSNQHKNHCGNTELHHP